MGGTGCDAGHATELKKIHKMTPHNRELKDRVGTKVKTQPVCSSG